MPHGWYRRTHAYGNYPETRSTIAREVTILPFSRTPNDDPLVMTAAQFDGMTDDEVDALPELPRVIARCSPQTKVKMIAALHRRGAYVAMTGDGVNDSPSLKTADVGIAMGMGGSDVAKQASDIVLTDDNFATIVRAVAEGRRLYANIQKFVLHLMSTNVAEVIVLICGLAFRDDNDTSVYPMSPIQILFLNMITSSPPAMGLGIEPLHPKTMKMPPRDRKQGLFSWKIIADMFYYGFIMGVLTLANFIIVIYALGNGQADLGEYCKNPTESIATRFTVPGPRAGRRLRVLSLLQANNCRALRREMWTWVELKRLYENKFLFYSLVIATLLIFPCIYIPDLNDRVFKMTYLLDLNC